MKNGLCQWMTQRLKRGFLSRIKKMVEIVMIERPLQICLIYISVAGSDQETQQKPDIGKGIYQDESNCLATYLPMYVVTVSWFCLKILLVRAGHIKKQMEPVTLSGLTSSPVLLQAGPRRRSLWSDASGRRSRNTHADSLCECKQIARR